MQEPSRFRFTVWTSRTVCVVVAYRAKYGFGARTRSRRGILFRVFRFIIAQQFSSFYMRGGHGGRQGLSFSPSQPDWLRWNDYSNDFGKPPLKKAVNGFSAVRYWVKLHENPQAAKLHTSMRNYANDRR